MSVGTHTQEVAQSIPSEREIENWLRRRIAEFLEVEVSEINVHKPIAAYGFDSAEAAGMATDLEDWLGRQLSAGLVSEWDTTRDLAGRLVADLRGGWSADADLS